MGLHGAQGIINCDQVTVVLVTGSDIKAAEGEAQHIVGVATQDPLAAGMSWVGAVREARGGKARHLAAAGMQGKAAAVCVRQDRRKVWTLQATPRA